MSTPTQSANTAESQSAPSTEEGPSNGHAAATGAGANTGAGSTREKTETELEADRLYEERMEEEYAKREGGA